MSSAASRKTPVRARSAPPAPAPARRRAPKVQDPDNWDARLGFLMHDVSRLRRSVFDESMKPAGLTRSQWWVLAHLSRHDGMIQSDLAGVLDLGKAALGGLLDRLEGLGFVERRADERDGRVKRVFLTGNGRQAVQQMRAKSHELSERILQGLSAQARQDLADSLAVVKKNLLALRAQAGSED
jgi:DNA-binding MarR family transcriptional regulator